MFLLVHNEAVEKLRPPISVYILRKKIAFLHEKGQQGTHTDRALVAQYILVDPAVLHNDEEILFRIFE
jgi:hypothetical protein